MIEAFLQNGGIYQILIFGALICGTLISNIIRSIKSKIHKKGEDEVMNISIKVAANANVISRILSTNIPDELKLQIILLVGECQIVSTQSTNIDAAIPEHKTQHKEIL